MTELIDSGFTIKNACNLSGYSRSLVYYKAKERHIPLDQEMSEKISEIIIQRPSYGTRRVTAMIRRFRSYCQQEEGEKAHESFTSHSQLQKKIQEGCFKDYSCFKTEHHVRNGFH